MDWPTVYAACVTVVPAWDAWGVDDGRPPTALTAAWRYYTAPIPAHRTALEHALAAAQLAWLLALREEVRTWRAGVDPGPVAAAQDAAFAILSLGYALLEEGWDRTNANLRNAASHAALATQRQAAGGAG